MHEEVDDGAPDCRGEQKVDAIEDGEEAANGEIDGGGAEGDDEVAEEAEGGGFGAASVCGLTAEDAGGDALEQTGRSDGDHGAVDDEGGGDVAAAGNEACEEDGFGGRGGGWHVLEIVPPLV